MLPLRFQTGATAAVRFLFRPIGQGDFHFQMEARVGGVALRRPRRHAKEAVLKASSPHISVLNPSLFKGLSVYVQSEDPTESLHVSQALQLVGAVVRSSSECVDIVVSPSRLPCPPRSRGRRLLAAAASDLKPAKHVLISQIPWVPDVLRAHGRVDEDNAVIVVADTRQQLRPMSLALRPIPAIHIGEIPRGYCRSPFDAIPEDTAASIASAKDNCAVVGPPQKGFCELCDVHYNDGEMHHKSAAHLATSASSVWNTFDRIAETMPAL
jgi:hypothetical protein